MMKDKKQSKDKVRPIRMNEKTWEKLQKKRGNVSWNKFLLELVNK